MSKLRLEFSRRQLGTGDARQLIAEIPKGSLAYEEVDFSLNNLSSAGLTVVLDVLKRCPKLRVLKLFKNRIDDVGADALADLCRKLPGIEEMHLSHNQFTAAGVKKIVVAAEEVRSPDATPLWLRVEQNLIDDPDAVFDQLVQQELSVCKRVDDKSCTARTCCKKCKVHLPFFHLQRWQNNGYSQSPAANAASPATARPAAYRPPALPKPSMNAAPSPGGAAPSPGGTSGWGSPGGWGSPVTATGPGKGAPASAPAPGKGFASAPGKGVGKGGKQGVMSTGGSPWGQGGGPAWGPGGHHNRTPADSPAQGISAISNRSAAGDSPAATAGRKVVNGTRDRPTSVIDGNGARRILPEQMQDGDSGSELVCTLCQYVMTSPMITSCSHLVCDPCFQSWVTEKVAEHKSGPTGKQPMPGMPCPCCNAILKKADILPLDQAQGPAATLLQRRWRNIQIRCVHHPEHFNHAFAKDAESLSRQAGVDCHWVGDQHSYENHLLQCTVERQLVSRLEAASGEKAGGILGGEPFAEPEPVNVSADDDEFEIGTAKFDFETNGDGQLSLRMNDLIKIFEVTPSGWAAGIKINPTTMEELGEAGWFPVGYLHRKE